MEISNEVFEPVFEGGVVVEIVLPGLEAEGAAGGDVLREVVDVEGFRRDDGVVGDGVVIDFRIGFDETGAEGHDGIVEEVEFREFVIDPRDVDGVDIGKEDEAVTICGELADALPHRFVWGENVAPRVVKFIRRGIGFKDFQRPVGVSVDVDVAGLEFVFASQQALETGGGIRCAGRQQAGE